MGIDRSIIEKIPIGLNIFIKTIDANSYVSKFLNKIAVTTILRTAVRMKPKPFMNVFLYIMI